MSLKDFFPIKECARMMPFGVQSPPEFREAFRASLPDRSYYAFDANILSRTEVEFVVYGMRDICYGGIGDEQCRYTTTVPEAVTKPAIDRKLLGLAVVRRANELQKIEDEIIANYADRLREELDA